MKRNEKQEVKKLQVPFSLRVTFSALFLEVTSLLQVAGPTFCRLKGVEPLPAVYAGLQYVDGMQWVTSLWQKVAA